MRMDADALEGPPEDAQEAGQEVIWSTQEAHWHVTPQGIRLLDMGDADTPEEHPITQVYEEGIFEPEPVQVSVRNSQGEPIEVTTQWDGWQLYLDVHPTEHPTMSPTSALRAVWRYYSSRYTRAVLALLTALLLFLSGWAVVTLFASLL